jgi:hypothetical protein
MNLYCGGKYDPTFDGWLFSFAEECQGHFLNRIQNSKKRNKGNYKAEIVKMKIKMHV